MQELRKFAADRWFTCRPGPGGVFYVYWSENRRSERKSTGTKELSAAQAFLDEWVRLFDAETSAGPTRLTIGDLWLAKYPDPPERVASAWKRLAPWFGHLHLADINQALEDRYIASRDAARSTVRMELSLLRSVWNHAVKQRRIASTDVPVLGPLPPASPPRDRWMSQEELDAVLEAAKPNRRIWAFMWLARETAARRTAIQELRWSQVDWETGMIHYLPPGATQTRKRKASVPISRALRPILEELHATRNPADPFVIGRGKRVNDAVKRIAAHVGVEGVTPHVFRHTKATRMARNGTPLFHIAGVLGNTVEQIERVYAKHSPEALAAAVNEEWRKAG